MSKSEHDVIKDFNQYVNMSVDELEEWLGTEASKSAGWTGDNEGGETVGHDSGNRIVDILKRNPDKSEDKYTEEDIQHMRKVVAYCKRHLAQESGMKETKSKEELEQTKSTKSLRNWGHDPLKGMEDKKEDKSEGESKSITDKAEENNDEEKADIEEPKKTANGENGNGDAKEEKSKPAKKTPAPKKEAEEKPAGRSQPSRSTRGVKKNLEESDQEDEPPAKKSRGDAPKGKRGRPAKKRGKAAKANDDDDDDDE